MNRLALCGVVAGPLFVLTFLIYGAFVAGALVVAFAAGTRPGFWGSLFIGAVGIGLIGSDIFVTDPVSGYPPGSPAVSEYTWHGLVHDLFAIPTFVVNLGGLFQ